MFENDRSKFWSVFMDEDRRRKVNLKRLANAIGRSPSTLYKFKDSKAGSPDLLEAISIELFGRSWIDIIAKQNAAQNEKQEAKADAGDGGSNMDYVKSLEKRIDALQLLIEQHIKAHGYCPDEDIKKTG